MRAIEAHVLRRLLSGQSPNGELAALDGPVRRLADHLAGLPAEARSEALQTFLAIVEPAEAERVTTALMDADPDAPTPEAEPPERPATLADLRRVVSDMDWPWPGWLASGVLNVLAADPGIGKTTVVAWLARLLWLGECWPDGQPNPFPARTPTLWVAADRHFAQLLALAESYGLPDEAMFLNSPPQNPMGGLDLDDPAELDALERRILATRPGLVVIDTVGASTGRDLCRAEQAGSYFGPLQDMAGRVGIPFVALTHLSANGEALGRRIVGAARCLWKLTCPDPEGQRDRRKLWVDKTYSLKPPALGMTIRDGACDFDSEPPAAAEAPKSGRPALARAKAEAFVCEALARSNDQPTARLVDEWTATGGGKSAFFDALKELEANGKLVREGKPQLLHLSRAAEPEAAAAPDPDAF